MAAPSLSDVCDWHPTWAELVRAYPEVDEKRRNESFNWPIDLNESDDEEEPCYPCYVTPSFHAMTTRDETRERQRQRETELFIDVFGIDVREANSARLATQLTSRRERKRSENWANGRKTHFRGKGSKAHKRANRARNLARSEKYRHDDAVQSRWLAAYRQCLAAHDYLNEDDEPWTYKRHLQWEMSD